MKITFLTPGTGSYYCGACMRDNALVKSLHRAGHAVEMLPMYLPLQLDEELLPSRRETPVFFGGINVYLQQKVGIFRHTPRWFDRLLNGTGLLRAAAARSHMTSARDHGEMTLAMLKLDGSGLEKEVEKLMDWLRQSRPDVLCLSTTLLAGFIPELKRQLPGVKVIGFFQGEDTFLDGLPEPFLTRCWEAMGEQLEAADLVISPSEFYAGLMARRLGWDDGRIEVLPNGIDLDGYGSGNREGPPVIGYLARLMREKGLELMVDAFIHLRKELGHPDARLCLVGTATRDNEELIEEMKGRLRKEGMEGAVDWHPNVSREEKARLLGGMSVFSVPACFSEAFGLYVIEAMACGVPVVQPDSSSFPELVGKTGGGLLVPPGSVTELASAWKQLLDDPERLADLGERGRRGVTEHYGVDTMQGAFVSLIENLGTKP